MQITTPRIEWRPHKKQEEFIELPFSIFEALYGGAAGGGKSELLVLLPIIYGFLDHPDFKGIILRRTFPELESEIIIRSQRYYRQAGGGGQYNEQKRRWQFKSGATLFFGHCEHEQDIRKYDSAEYNYIAFDELTHFSEFQYEYLSFTRGRSGTLELPSIIRSATNPGNIGHGWVRRRFVEPYPNGGKILVDETTKNKRFFIQAKASDNPYVDPLYVSRLQMLPEAERKAKLDGDWWTFSGQVFTDFRSERLSDEPDNAVHIIKPFEIPKWWPRVLAIDWGTSALTIALWGGISPEGRLYIYREYACNGGESHPHLPQNVKTANWATDIGILSRDEELSDVVLDSNAWDNRNEDQSVADEFSKFSGLIPRKADKGPGSRISGRALVQEYLRFIPKPRREQTEQYDPMYAQYLIKNKGFEAYKTYETSFKPEPMENNLPKLQIFNTCQILNDAIPLCVWDPNNKEDVAQFSGDDPYDTLRYLIKAAYHHVQGVRQIANRMEALEVARKMVTEGNITGHYMAMKKIEASDRDYGIQRFRRRFK